MCVGVLSGIRTRVSWVRTRVPRPLADEDMLLLKKRTWLIESAPGGSRTPTLAGRSRLHSPLCYRGVESREGIEPSRPLLQSEHLAREPAQEERCGDRESNPDLKAGILEFYR